MVQGNPYKFLRVCLCVQARTWSRLNAVMQCLQKTARWGENMQIDLEPIICFGSKRETIQMGKRTSRVTSHCASFFSPSTDVSAVVSGLLALAITGTPFPNPHSTLLLPVGPFSPPAAL